MSEDARDTKIAYLKGQLVLEKAASLALKDRVKRGLTASGGTYSVLDSNILLKQAVASETRDLNEARRAAEAASEAKSMFLANMSHEIRTPMNGVIGMCRLLSATNLTCDQRGYLDTIAGSAHALLGVVNDVLDFTKIESGEFEIEEVAYSPHDVVRDVARLLGPKADDRKLRLRIEFCPSLPDHLAGDPGRIRQVLLNLASNAVKFTDRGIVTIVVEPVVNADADQVIRFTVKDTGIGIAPEATSRLFRSFDQLDVSTTRKYGGSGLGLTIAKRLAELMGGEIGVRSNEGVGSEFWFTVRSGVVRAVPLQGSDPVHGATPRWDGRRVLVAEDNSVNQAVIRFMLKKRGFEVDCVNVSKPIVPNELFGKLQRWVPFSVRS